MIVTKILWSVVKFLAALFLWFSLSALIASIFTSDAYAAGSASVPIFFSGIALYLLYVLSKWMTRKSRTVRIKKSDVVEEVQTHGNKAESVSSKLNGATPLSNIDYEFVEVRRELIQTISKHVEDVTEQDVQKVPRVGFVYLLKAGPFYKIGKFKDPEKRIRQIKLQLPYPVEVVHVVTSSNMSYLETHWHKRFADKRANGEWFLLTANDVSSFVNQ